jgi:hypothetical protein
MTSFQEVSEVNFNAFPCLASMERSLAKSGKKPSKATAFLGELFFLFKAVLCQRELRAIKAQEGKFFNRLGITLRYPLENLPAQCESIRKELAPRLLDHLEHGIKNYSKAERGIMKMKVEAQEARMPLLCRKLDKILEEIDELITFLQDVNQVFSSIYGPERAKIDSLNKKISNLLSA